MATRRKSSSEIESAEQELERARERYLRGHGWTLTSSTPGCLWLWRKATPDGEILLLETNTAVRMQQLSCSIRGNEW